MTKDEALAYSRFKRTDTLPCPIPAVFEAMFALEDCVRELEGRACGGCEHNRVDDGVDAPLWCNLLTTFARGKYPIYCKDVKGSCGAFKEKPHAKDEA